MIPHAVLAMCFTMEQGATAARRRLAAECMEMSRQEQTINYALQILLFQLEALSNNWLPLMASQIAFWDLFLLYPTVVCFFALV